YIAADVVLVEKLDSAAGALLESDGFVRKERISFDFEISAKDGRALKQFQNIKKHRSNEHVLPLESITPDMLKKLRENSDIPGFLKAVFNSSALRWDLSRVFVSEGEPMAFILISKAGNVASLSAAWSSSKVLGAVFPLLLDAVKAMDAEFSDDVIFKISALDENVAELIRKFVGKGKEKGGFYRFEKR
ncbi:MAG: hypothetical protein IJC39_00700, partial [Firmicutes bacterium]|nr:hypothetical protein [Bacillota bacterium]